MGNNISKLHTKFHREFRDIKHDIISQLNHVQLIKKHKCASV